MYDMTGRERAIKAMNFEPTDRLPIMANGLGSPKYVQKLTNISEEDYWADQPAAHFQAMRILGMDFHIQNWFPPREETQRSWTSTQYERWQEPEMAAEDLKSQTSQMEGSLRSFSTEEREKRVQAICDYQIKMQERMGGDLLWVFGMDFHGAHIIGFPYGKYGYEAFFLVCGLYPEVLGRYWKAASRLALLHNECVVEAARRLDWPRIGYLGTDMTDQRGNMVSPKMMAQYYFPHLEYAIEPLVDAGFKLIWHSDGNMDEMIRPLIDIGIAGFQGFQEECGTRIAEVAKLRNRSGEPLILWGSVSVTRVLRTGTFEDIRREVQRVLDEWPHPGLCLATASYISPDVPEENITELYRLFRILGEVRRSL